MDDPKFPTVILGAGFVGLFTALHLNDHRYSAPVVLIDKRITSVSSPSSMSI